MSQRCLSESDAGLVIWYMYGEAVGGLCACKHDSFEHLLSHAFIHIGLVPCKKQLPFECL